MDSRQRRQMDQSWHGSPSPLVKRCPKLAGECERARRRVLCRTYPRHPGACAKTGALARSWRLDVPPQRVPRARAGLHRSWSGGHGRAPTDHHAVDRAAILGEGDLANQIMARNIVDVTGVRVAVGRLAPAEAREWPLSSLDRRDTASDRLASGQ